MKKLLAVLIRCVEYLLITTRTKMFSISDTTRTNMQMAAFAIASVLSTVGNCVVVFSILSDHKRVEWKDDLPSTKRRIEGNTRYLKVNLVFTKGVLIKRLFVHTSGCSNINLSQLMLWPFSPFQFIISASETKQNLMIIYLLLCCDLLHDFHFAFKRQEKKKQTKY